MNGTPIHRNKVLKTCLAKGTAKRIHLEQLPGFAPNLNHDEGIWQNLKRYEFGNACCSDVEKELLRARERVRHKRAVIRGCFTLVGYSAF